MTSSNRIKTEIVRGTERYAGAPARDLGLGISLESDTIVMALNLFSLHKIDAIMFTIQDISCFSGTYKSV